MSKSFNMNYVNCALLVVVLVLVVMCCCKNNEGFISHAKKNCKERCTRLIKKVRKKRRLSKEIVELLVETWALNQNDDKKLSHILRRCKRRVERLEAAIPSAQQYLTQMDALEREEKYFQELVTTFKDAGCTLPK